MGFFNEGIPQCGNLAIFLPFIFFFFISGLMDLRTESKARGYSEDSTTDLEYYTHKFEIHSGWFQKTATKQVWRGWMLIFGKISYLKMSNFATKAKFWSAHMVEMPVLRAS